MKYCRYRLILYLNFCRLHCIRLEIGASENLTLNDRTITCFDIFFNLISKEEGKKEKSLKIFFSCFENFENHFRYFNGYCKSPMIITEYLRRKKKVTQNCPSEQIQDVKLLITKHLVKLPVQISYKKFSIRDKETGFTLFSFVQHHKIVGHSIYIAQYFFKKRITLKIISMFSNTLIRPCAIRKEWLVKYFKLEA